MKLGQNAPDLSQLHKGDLVTASFYQSAAVMLAKPGTEPTGVEQEDFVVSPQSGQPGGMAVRTIKTTATIEDIDAQKRSVTLKEANGQTLKLKVDASVQNLDQIKKGDEIVVRYTEAAAISITKPSQPQH